MQSWQKHLNGDPLPWLLDPENPSVRYWTLVDILDRPASAAEVQEARAGVAQQPLVQELFALQHPSGYWGEDETKPYTAQGAVAALALLYMLGVIPDERTAMGCDSFLRFCQHESGGFSLTKTVRSGSPGILRCRRPRQEAGKVVAARPAFGVWYTYGCTGPG